MSQSIPLRPAGVLLTRDDILAWQNEIRELEEERDRIEDQISELEENIGLAKELIARISPRAADPLPVAAKDEPKAALTLPDAIFETIKQMGGRASYGAIKAQLMKNSTQEARLKSNPNYFYTAIKRLKERDMIIQSADNILVIEAKTGANSTAQNRD